MYRAFCYDIYMRYTPEQLLKASIGYALKKGLIELAEDFGQYVVTEDLSGKHKDIKYHYVDFMRSEFGNTRHKIGRARSEARKQSFEPNNDTLPCERSKPKRIFDSMEVREYIKLMPRYQRAVFMLYCYWGFNQEEISELFGCTKSNVSQVIKTLTKLVRKKIAEEKYNV